MKRSASTPHRNLEILRRPEGGAGGTGPPVVPPAGPAKARRDVVATLYELIDTLMGPDDAGDEAVQTAPEARLPLLLNAIQAGALLSISRSKVLDLAARGKIPSIRVGGSVRIPRDRLIDWIEDRCQQHKGLTTSPIRTSPRFDRGVGA